MKRCKRCNNEMIETQGKRKPVLLKLMFTLIILLVLGYFSLDNDNIIVKGLLIIYGIYCILYYIAAITAIICKDNIIRYECQKCGYSKQKISIIAVIIEIITDIF